MSTDLYAAKVVSDVLAERARSEIMYRTLPDSNLYFMMIDLSQSTNYRIKHGAERGYIRGESFFALVRATVRRYGDVRNFKEVGDAVLLCCDQFRPFVEIAIILNLAVRQLSVVSDDEQIPFFLRAGIDFGVVKRLDRNSEDYLGEAIDRLSRIMLAKSEISNILVSEQVFGINKAILNEYSRICKISGPLQLILPSEKSVSSLIVYREIIPVAVQGKPFTDYFEVWK